MPATGSFSALPSIFAPPSMEPKPAAERSTAAALARSKVPTNSPSTKFFTFLKVSSRFDPD